MGRFLQVSQVTGDGLAIPNVLKAYEHFYVFPRYVIFVRVEFLLDSGHHVVERQKSIPGRMREW